MPNVENEGASGRRVWGKLEVVVVGMSSLVKVLQVCAKSGIRYLQLDSKVGLREALVFLKRSFELTAAMYLSDATLRRYEYIISYSGGRVQVPAGACFVPCWVRYARKSHVKEQTGGPQVRSTLHPPVVPTVTQYT